MAWQPKLLAVHRERIEGAVGTFSNSSTIPILGTNIPIMGIIVTKNTKPPNPSIRHATTAPSVGLADALFTRTQQRLFSLLFGQPQRTFLATELIRLAGIGRGTVQRELKRLIDTGLVTVMPVANQKHLRANLDSPVFEELVSIVRKTIGLAEPLRKALQQAGAQIHVAILVGSVARHTDKAASDIDLLIVSDDLTLEDTYEMLDPVEKQLDRKINPTLYTTDEFNHRRKRQNRFLSAVLGGDHVVLIGAVDGT